MTARARGELAIVLHTHLPYVEGFGTWPFGEEWLWEAMATSYLPLLAVLEERHPGGGAPLTLSITPVLADQLEADNSLRRQVRAAMIYPAVIVTFALIVMLALIAFIVWGHHMFTSGQSTYAMFAFSFLTFFVAIPTAIKEFSWVATIWKGSIALNSPMLYTLAFLIIFAIGGLTGVIQVGVGFIQHHHRRVTEDGACQADALALAAREQATGFAHRRVVALGQPQDHLVDAGAGGRIDDGLFERLAHFEMPIDILDHHGGIIDQNADGQRQSAQGHNVNRLFLNMQ